MDQDGTVMSKLLAFLTPTIIMSDVCKAFDLACVGTRVNNTKVFMAYFADAIGTYHMPEHGRGFVSFPSEWMEDINQRGIVSCGTGYNAGRSDEDYVIRTWRGQKGIFLKREFAPKLETLHVVVSTKEAYLRDPDVMKRTEYHAALKAERGVKYVIIAVLGTIGPVPPFGYQALVHNIAGGNEAFIPKFTADEIHLGRLELENMPLEHAQIEKVKALKGMEDLAMLHKWITMARETEAYNEMYSTVAD